MKRKRVGAGQRGSSNPFLFAKDLLKPSTTESGGFYNENREGCGEMSVDVKEDSRKEAETETSLCVTSIRGRAQAASLSLNSPTKGGRAMSKKQQKLAEASKSSRNISQYFTKKQTAEKSQDEEEEMKGDDATLCHTPTVELLAEEQSSPDTTKAVESSPVESDTSDVIAVENKVEVIVIPDDDDDDEGIHEEEVLELLCEQDASLGDSKSTTE